MGLLGKLSERLILAGYLERFIATRAQVIKQIAESEEWRKFLPGS
jgi:hypothetical protein